MPIPTRSSLFAAALLLAMPSVSHGQTGPRWRAWIGCWSAVAQANTTSTTEQSPILCVTPTQDADVVEINAISNGSVVSRDRLDASGRAQTIDAGGCTGTTRASWSEDQRRVFLRSSVTCSGQPSETSAILAISSAGGGEWLDVRGVTAGGNSETRVARYRDIGLPSTIPAEIASAIRERDMSVRNARLASASPVGSGDIIEASRSADPAIVEAWLLENGQQYALDAATLRQLADAGVPARVTDALVNSARARESNERYLSEGDREVGYASTTYDPWAYGVRYNITPYRDVRRHVYYYASPGFHFSLFGFGYTPYGYAYAPFGYYPYGYRSVGYVPFGFNYGYNYGRNYGYRPPVVIVNGGRSRPSDPRYEPRTARPRVTREGYSQLRTTDQGRDNGSRGTSWGRSGGEEARAVWRSRTRDGAGTEQGRSQGGQGERSGGSSNGRTARGRP